MYLFCGVVVVYLVGGVGKYTAFLTFNLLVNSHLICAWGYPILVRFTPNPGALRLLFNTSALNPSRLLIDYWF